MICPECEHELKEKRWITNHWFGDVMVLEVLWWLFLFPLTFLGSIGWAILAGIVITIAILSHGKRWYKCKNCGYSEMKKISNNL